MNRAEWLAKYPDHCKTCEANTDSANPCAECLQGLMCPRCGRLQTDDGQNAIDPEDANEPCRVCGWLEHSNMGCPDTMIGHQHCEQCGNINYWTDTPFVDCQFCHKPLPVQPKTTDSSKDVHTEHCCKKHGCKYGDEDCPVASGTKPQSFPCEECGVYEGYDETLHKYFLRPEYTVKLRLPSDLTQKEADRLAAAIRTFPRSRLG